MTRSIALLLLLPVLVSSGPALAQVHVDNGALDRLSATPAPAATAASHAAPAHHSGHSAKRPAPPHHATAPAKSAPKSAAKAEPAAPAAPVRIPAAPPTAAVIAPPPPGPPAHPLLPPVIPMVEHAAGDVTTIPGGLRVTFGPGKSDLSPATVDALHKLAQAFAPNPAIDVNVYGYAAGAPDDPSTPRRLSLSRALAARAVLMSDNIPSTRIYVHALGSTASSGPQDRVDVQNSDAARLTAPAAPALAPVSGPAPAPAPAVTPGKG